MSEALTALEHWRAKARCLLQNGAAPAQVEWGSVQSTLFDIAGQADLKVAAPSVPKDFLPFAKRVACHSDPDKWSLLYQALWRLNHGEAYLLKLATDPLVHRLTRMAQQVGRDAHKAKAFVRFRLTEEDGQPHYIAWHKPDHFILGIIAPFFQRRFEVMRWTVFTPYESASWNGEALRYGDGLAEDPVDGDDFERVWKAYYKSTFNPARVKINMMKREMPVRYWATMPETELIPELLADAETRVRAMIDAHNKG